MAEIPKDLLFTEEHEYVRTTDDADVVEIGITDYAQDALGDVVFVQLPNKGDRVEAGKTMGEVESTKSVSEIYAPLGGTVVEVNAELADNPQRLNEDPYGDGWLVRIRLGDASEADALLDADAYRAFVAEQ